MRLHEIERLRDTSGRTALLFLTDRCPVGCSHCSVDSRPDGPSIVNRELFEEIIEALARRPGLELVGISGGEPFVERWGLQLAVAQLRAGEKETVLYTSGIWASERTPDWTAGVLAACTTMVLSTDAFHAAAIDEDRACRALDTALGAGADVVVQVLDLPDAVERGEQLLVRALGEDWRAVADLSVVPPLPYGRARGRFALAAARAGHSFGRCRSLNAPVVRYDGRIIACCNEQVIVGGGPPQLRRDVESAEELELALDELAADSLLQALRSVGGGPLTRLPRFAGLGEERHDGICSLCWKMHARRDGRDASTERLLSALACSSVEVER